MPSFLHQALVMLFRNRPELAVELLRDVHNAELPSYTEIKVEDVKLDLSDIVPGEYHSDLVVLLLDGKPVLAIVVEVQLKRQDRKRFTWPAYVSSLRAQFECPCVLFVFCTDDQVADWAAQPIDMGFGSRVTPLVIGPRGVPVVRSPDAAAELALLSVMAHGQGDVKTAVEIALAATGAAHSLDADRQKLYYDLIEASLSEAARKEFAMLPQGYEYQSESMRRSYREGSVANAVSAVLRVLKARSIALTDEQRTRIEECTELETLDAWLEKAATVSAADDLFTK